MIKTRKIFLWMASLVGVLFVLAIGTALLVAHLFNSGVIGRDFQAGVEARYHIRAKNVRIGFPYPVVVLRGVTTAIPGTLEASIEKMVIHPGLLPLLTGKFEPAKIQILSPVIAVRLPRQPVPSAESGPSIRPAGLMEKIFSPLAAALPEMAKTALLARDCTVKISGPNGRSYVFAHLDFKSSTRRSSVGFRLTGGRSGFWHAMELKGRVDPVTLKGSGDLNVTGGDLDNLARVFAVPGSGRFGGSISDFTAALFYNAPANFRADFTASVPSIAFGVGPKTMTLGEGFLSGVLQADAKGVQLSLSSFRFDRSHLNLTIICTQKSPDGGMSLTIDGSDTDVATIRSILFAVNEKTDGVEHFFDILRKGRIPKISFGSRANDLSGLLKLENMTLKCPVEKGVVFAPKADLLVSNVSGNIEIKGGVLTATHVSGKTNKGSSTQEGELTIGLPQENPLFHLDLPIEADLSELPAVLGSLAKENNLAKDSPLARELAQVANVTGKTRGRLIVGENLGDLGVKVGTGRFRLSCRYGNIPGPVSLEGVSFSMEGDKIGFGDTNAAIADAALTVSGNLRGFFGPRGSGALKLKGRLGPEANKIAASLAGLPKWLKPVSGMEMPGSAITWEKGAKTRFSGKMQLSGGPLLEADVIVAPGEFSIRSLAVKDRDSDARIAVDFPQEGLRIGFSGTLASKTVDGLITGDCPFKGSIAGTLKADFYPGSPQKSSGAGEISLSDFRLPSVLPASATVDRATIEAQGKKLLIKSGVATWEGSRLNLAGSVNLTGGSYLLDLNTSTERLDLDRILKSEWVTRKVEGKPAARPGSSEKAWDLPFTGVVRVKTERLAYAKMTWAPAEGDVLLKHGSADIHLTRASICGISTPGRMGVTPEGADISLDLSAKGKDLQAMLACFFSNQRLLSGSYEMSGHINARGPGIAGKAPGGAGGLAQSLQGAVEFKARDGRIFRFNAFTKIASILSVSEIYRGVVPDLVNKGCKYKTLQLHGNIKDGMLTLSDSVLDGPSIKMVFSGQVDLVRGKLNVVALVAPQRTLERVVNATPVVGKVLKDAFVTVPVRISGDLAAPTVVVLSPGAVSREIVGVMQRMVKLPFTIFQPLVKNGSSGK